MIDGDWMDRVVSFDRILSDFHHSYSIQSEHNKNIKDEFVWRAWHWYYIIFGIIPDVIDEEPIDTDDDKDEIEIKR